MLQFVRCTLQYGNNMPRAGVNELQFVNNFVGRVGSDGTSGKHNVANQVDPRVWLSGVDELAMICTLFFHKVFSNLPACRQPHCELF